MKNYTQNTNTPHWINPNLQPSYLSILLCIVTLFAPSQSIAPHGTVTYPPSRVWICYQEDPQSPDSPACAASIIGWGTQAFYDWNEVARMDANGMHRDIIADGNLASAGRPDKFGGLDQVRNDWVATPVSAGPFTVTWTNSVPHQTLYYDVYITKADWTPDQPLTWDSLERLVRTAPRDAASTDEIDVVLPRRTGRHIIYSIWQRSLTAEAFYATSDVDFGTEPGPNAPPVGAFTSDNGRCGGSEVSFNAADSADPNGDALTYSWDFGDGTTAQGIEVTHTYTDLDSATVTLTVSDGEFSSGVTEPINLLVDPDCAEIPCPFDTPTATPLPSVVGSYKTNYVLGEDGPDLSNLFKLDINWNLNNPNGLYQFSLQTFDGIPAYWTDLRENIVHTFTESNPEMILSNTGFEGLDGAYYVTVDDGNFVMVSQTGGFSLYFSTATVAPECGAVTSPTNTAPVADLKATPITGISPLEVTIDASAATDIDNDILTYRIDYGDGTFGTEANSTHRYTTGTYTATVTVSDGQGGTDTASVAITVTDADTPPITDCTFDTPRATALPTTGNTTYDYIAVFGTGGPNIEGIAEFTVNWDLQNNGLYQFSFRLNATPWYVNFSNSASQTFNAPNPQISLTNTGIPGLDGTYYVTLDDGNFVMVAEEYTLYFSTSSVTQDCTSVANGAKRSIEEVALDVFPNPATTSVSLRHKTNLQGSIIAIATLGGKELKSLAVLEHTTTMVMEVSELSPGLYLLRILEPSGRSSVLKLIVN